MGKSVYIAEKPSVAQEFAKALKLKTRRGDGFCRIGGSDRDLVRRAFGHDELSRRIRSGIEKMESEYAAFHS